MLQYYDVCIINLITYSTFKSWYNRVLSIRIEMGKHNEQTFSDACTRDDEGINDCSDIQRNL